MDEVIKVTESEVCFTRRGENEEGWIRSSCLCVLLVLKYLKEGEQCKIRMMQCSGVCEHIDLQDGHR